MKVKLSLLIISGKSVVQFTAYKNLENVVSKYVFKHFQNQTAHVVCVLKPSNENEKIIHTAYNNIFDDMEIV
ncbi:CLUMA_CG021672, isoform A [Clunio marinus]|uniref:CLUMA_CG021672, isoform A n=1 Tax=Clunio marinus TaxID=568069 RepID=A0A1J1J9G9_9DIPT|nr:CLUMA_CG021672, isoform A [Clunio marinus]